MKKQFLAYLKKNNLCTKKDTILLAVSGGIDSMLMANLFIETGFEVVIATCNHNLRGAESRVDAEFVRDFFKENKSVKSVHLIDLEVNAYIEKHKSNLQEAARILRYEALFNLAKTENLTHIATAHNLDDKVETTLFNLANKTGIRGLSGIKATSENKNFEGIKLIRPMLFASKRFILAYSKINTITYREDSTNASDKYSRNFIRHHIIPQFEKINTGFLENVSETSNFLADYEQLVDFLLNDIKKKTLTEEKNILKINYFELKNYPALPTVLFELIKDFGFNAAQVSEIIYALESCHSGKIWQTNTHQLLCDRGNILIRIFNKNDIQNAPNEYFIQKENCNLTTPHGILQFEFLENTPVTFPNNPNIIFLDVTKSVFPLCVRYWKEGDFFLPLGLSGKRKKVQDFFTNLKLNLFQKEETLILECDNQIAWIVGLRSDYRFRITPTTSVILKVTYFPA
jgi:tRNA(Ile)-lysidine synthase